MKDSADLIFTMIIIICLVGCYSKMSELSHRMDMIIVVQQSQQKHIDKLMENIK